MHTVLLSPATYADLLVTKYRHGLPTDDATVFVSLILARAYEQLAETRHCADAARAARIRAGIERAPTGTANGDPMPLPPGLRAA